MGDSYQGFRYKTAKVSNFFHPIIPPEASFLSDSIPQLCPLKKKPTAIDLPEVPLNISSLTQSFVLTSIRGFLSPTFALQGLQKSQLRK